VVKVPPLTQSNRSKRRFVRGKHATSELREVARQKVPGLSISCIATIWHRNKAEVGCMRSHLLNESGARTDSLRTKGIPTAVIVTIDIQKLVCTLLGDEVIRRNKEEGPLFLAGVCRLNAFTRGCRVITFWKGQAVRVGQVIYPSNCRRSISPGDGLWERKSIYTAIYLVSSCFSPPLCLCFLRPQAACVTVQR
jgi:hypothetical protein